MEKILNLLGVMKKRVLSHTKGKFEEVYILQELSDKQEEILDKTESVIVKDPITKVNLKLNKNDILLYGEIDFNNEEDCNILKKYNCIMHNDNAFVHSGFDFNKDSVTITDVPKFYPTSDPILLFKYNYVMVGRPKKVIVYKKKV